MAVIADDNVAASRSDTEAELPPRSLRFPAGRSLGELFVRNGAHQADDYAFWESVGRAQGAVSVAAGKELRLNVNPQASADLSPLRALPANAVQYLQLSASRVTNDSLAHMAHLTGLRVLWLYDTRISDAGLVHLHGLTGLRVLNLRSTLASRGGIDALQKKLPQCEFRRPW